ncbi:C39 family peptidase [Massilia sp. BSC265]|uniref:C39 family peptidase n=1 Tax=Massilia sp. BSC265 TaxID=1549812 RepID=UPI0004E8914A|nr:C39 family peptidase [Massilia sp. BSC265]KFI07984.1 peptidase C39 [Massilia sp. BSC265]
MKMVVAISAAVGGMLLAPGCPASSIELAVGQRATVPVTSLKDIKFRKTTRQQFDFSCGSAALATLLTYHYDTPVSEKEVFEKMFLTGDQAKIRQQGFSMLDMKRYLATRGFVGDGFQQPLDKLLEAKLPAIVLISDRGYNHFVVIKGAEDGRILLGDPSSGARSVTRERFMELWANRLLFVVHRYPSTIAKADFNGADDWRSAPRAPLGTGINQEQYSQSLPKFGPGDF